MKVCHGTCNKYVPEIDPNLGYYDRGFKRCTVCDTYIKWAGRMCPCCNAQLRARPRSKENRQRYREIKGIKFTKL